jgi:steroid delta-isomerase-like uncharacterized protein
MTPAVGSELRARRQAVVDQHVDAENTGDMDAMIASFKTPRYEVFPMGAVFEGEQPVRDMVGGLIAGFPDFKFTPVKTHHSDDAVIVEGLMTGTHKADWAGMPPKGNKLELPLVCIFDFDGADLVNEKVYFDFAAVQRQLS